MASIFSTFCYLEIIKWYLIQIMMNSTIEGAGVSLARVGIAL